MDVYTEYGRISVHCDVVICTGQKLSGFQNTPVVCCFSFFLVLSDC